MAEPSITQALRALGPNDDKGFAALARTIADKSGTDVRELVTILHGSNAAEASKAAAVLLELQQSAFGGMLAGLNTKDPASALWDAQVLTSIELESRRRLVRALDALLDDTSDRVIQKIAGSEEQPIPRRVCDDAYLLERQLLNSGEAEDAQAANQRLFLKLSNDDKSAEIAKARGTRQFTDFRTP